MKAPANLFVLLAVLVSGAALGDSAQQAERPATVMDVGLAYLSNQLFQMAYSEHETLNTRSFLQTRFIPQQVAAYFLKEDSGNNIKIVVTHRHADPNLSREDAQNRCRAMINWVRFHLGVKDDGSLIAYASAHDSSTLYQFVGTSESISDRDWALFLDRQTIIIGDVAVLSGGKATAVCNEPLIKR